MKSTSGFRTLTAEKIEHAKYEFDPCPEGLVSSKFPKKMVGIFNKSGALKDIKYKKVFGAALLML